MRQCNLPVTYDELTVAHEPRGLQAPSVWFGGGRIGAHLEQHGTLEEIAYYGAQPMHRQTFFKVNKHSPYQRIFCPYILVADRAYQLELEQTRIFPAGYVSRLSLPEEELELEHALIMLNDAVMYRVRVLHNGKKHPLRLRLTLHEYLRATHIHRQWDDWNGDLISGAQVIRVTDLSEKDGATRIPTWIALAGTQPVSTHLTRSQRRFFETDVLAGDAAALSLIFCHREADVSARVQGLQTDGVLLGDAQIQIWEETLRAAPALRMGNPAVESFFRQTGLITQMLMPTDMPGAMRAAVGHYWVWGWDTMVYCDSYLISGQTGFVRDALEFYRRTAHPEHGIGHQFDESLNVTIPQALSAQGLYINMLYQYFSFTGDHAALREFYPFARQTFERTISQTRKAGLFTGIALWPDYPQHAGQKGGDEDLSIFNNAIFYQAARAMELLAGELGDACTADTARSIWRELETSFRDRLWDREKQYWVDSLDSATLQKRPSYPAHAILWVNPFARDLVAGYEEPCAAFLAANHVCRGGIRPYARWDPAFNGDGNQLAQYYPTGPDLFFLKVMSATGRQSLLRKWLGWIEAFWEQYTVPEGITLEAENDGPHRPDCPGGKQPFTAKPWHIGLLASIAGVNLDHGGITIEPGLDQPLTVTNLVFQGEKN